MKWFQTKSNFLKNCTELVRDISQIVSKELLVMSCDTVAVQVTLLENMA